MGFKNSTKYTNQVSKLLTSTLFQKGIVHGVWCTFPRQWISTYQRQSGQHIILYIFHSFFFKERHNHFAYLKTVEPKKCQSEHNTEMSHTFIADMKKNVL